MTVRNLLPLFLLPFGLFAEEPSSSPKTVEPRTLPAPDQPVAEHEPAVTRLEDGRVKIGDILLDPKSREIRFPAEINMNEGLLEFIVVHQNGKIHESLLSTKISATKLNIAIKLLHYKASRELYLKLEDDGSLSSEFETASPEEMDGSKVQIGFEWQEDGATKTATINEWISHAATEKPMPHEPWIYGGSFVVDGTFVAESSGDIIAIFLSNAAIINFAGEDNQDDEVWLPHPKRIPEVGTAVTVVISPFKPNK